MSGPVMFVAMPRGAMIAGFGTHLKDTESNVFGVYQADPNAK